MAATLQSKQMQSYAYWASTWYQVLHVRWYSMCWTADSKKMKGFGCNDHWCLKTMYTMSLFCQLPKWEKSQAWCTETSEDSITKTFSLSARLALDHILSTVYSHGRHIQCIEGIQRATTKLVPALRKLDYGQTIQKLGLTILETS